MNNYIQNIATNCEAIEHQPVHKVRDFLDESGGSSLTAYKTSLTYGGYKGVQGAYIIKCPVTDKVVYAGRSDERNPGTPGAYDALAGRIWDHACGKKEPTEPRYRLGITDRFGLGDYNIQLLPIANKHERDATEMVLIYMYNPPGNA